MSHTTAGPAPTRTGEKNANDRTMLGREHIAALKDVLSCATRDRDHSGRWEYFAPGGWGGERIREIIAAIDTTAAFERETVTVNGQKWTRIDVGVWSTNVPRQPSVHTLKAFVHHAHALDRIASDARALQALREENAQLKREVDRATELAAAAITQRNDALERIRELEAGQERLAAVAPSPSASGDTQGSPPAPAPSSPPAPIPLGATVTDGEGRQWVWRDTDGVVGWRDPKHDYVRAIDWRAATLTALYHAHRPVDSREMVERASRAVEELAGVAVSPRDRACHILRAAGFTIEEGA